MNRRPLLLVALSFSMPAAVPPSSEQSSGIKVLADTLMIQAEGRSRSRRAFLGHFRAGPGTAKRLTSGLSNPWRRLARPAQNNGVQASHTPERRIDDSAFLRRRPQEEVRPRETRTDSRNSVADGIADFRSLTYSLSDQQAAKQKAVAKAVEHS
jgi:hypothetical protein